VVAVSTVHELELTLASVHDRLERMLKLLIEPEECLVNRLFLLPLQSKQELPDTHFCPFNLKHLLLESSELLMILVVPLS
jgi:hypothetical protein